MPPKLFADRRLHGLLLLAAVLRLVVGLNVWHGDPTASALLSDSSYYRDWALALNGGASFPFEGAQQPYWMPPLFAWLLAALGGSVKLTLLVQSLLGLITCAMVVGIGDELLGSDEKTRPKARQAALLGGLLWTLYGPVMFFEGRLLGACLATLLGAIALLCSLRWRRSGRSTELLIAGLALGLMSLTRPNTLLAIPALAAWAAWISRTNGRAVIKSVLTLGLPALLAIAPALIHNHNATGRVVPITVNGGVNFYFGNNPASHGTFHAPGIEWGSIRDQRATARQIAAADLGQPELTDTEASSYWFGRGLDYLVESPADATRLWSLKLADLCSSTEYGIQYNLAAAREVAPALWLVSLPFGLLLLFAAAGWQRGPSPIVIAWLLAGLASALLYFTYSRFRLPLLPILMPFAGLGLLRLVTRCAKPTALFAGLLLAIQSFVPFEGTYPSHLRSHAFLDMAGALEATPANRDRRAALLDRSIALVPGNKPARTTRGQIAFEAGDITRALAEYEAAAALSAEFPTAEFELARLLAAHPDPALRNLPRARQIIASWLAAHDPASPDADAFRNLAAALK